MMPTQPAVVIIGRDGTEHVFPSGFDPQRAAAIVRQGNPSTSPPAAATAGMLPPSTMAGDPTTARPPSPRQRLTDAMAEHERHIAEDPLKQVGVGMEKGLENTVIGTGEMVRNVPGVSHAVDALYGRDTLGDFDTARTMNQPTNTAQRIGYAAEQVGEFLALPTGKGNLARRIAQEGLQSGAVSAAQGGDPVAGALTGAAAPVLTKAVGAVAPKIVPAIRETVQKKVVQALGPTKERYKAMAQRIAPEIMKRGLGGSRKALLEQAATVADDVGAQIDDALQQFRSRQIGVAPVVDALEHAKSAFQTTRQVPLTEALKSGLERSPGARVVGNVVEIPVVYEPRAVKQLTDLQRIVGELGDSATVEQLTAVRRAWDKVVDQAGGFAHRAGGAIGVPLSDQTEAWAKREATGAIRKLLAEEVPELAALNKEFAFWKSMKDVLTQTMQRTQPHGPGLGRQVAEVAGAAAGSGSGLGQAFLVGKLAGAARAVFTSPRWRLLDARMRNHLADAIASGNTQAVTGALARVNAALTGGGALRPVPSH